MASVIKGTPTNAAGEAVVLDGGAKVPTATLGSGTADSTTFLRGDQSFAGVLGVGQTWQNVTASRAYATTYTNSTGKPIGINVVGNASSNTVDMYLNINGGGAQSIAHAIWGLSFFAVIPVGATYAVTTNSGLALISWMELR